MSENDPKVASQLPKPTGYKLLIALPNPEEKTEGGILKATQTLEAEEIGSIVGFVLAAGPDAYKSPDRFPSGPLLQRRGLDHDAFLFRNPLQGPWERVPSHQRR